MATALARMTDPKEIRFQQPKEIRFQQPKKKKDEGEIVFIPSPVQQRKKKAPPNHRSVVNLDQLFNCKKRGDNNNNNNNNNNNSTNENDENVDDQKPKVKEAAIAQPLRNGDNVYYQKPKETAATTAQPIVTKRQGFGLMDLDDTDQPSRPQGWISPKKNEETTTTSRETENSSHENDKTPAVVPNDPVFVDPPEPPEEQEPPTKNIVCPAGLDIDVFSDLPPDIQQELMNQGDKHLNLCARLDSEKTESTAYYHTAFTSKKSSVASSTTSESNLIMNLLLDDSNSKNDIITKNNNTSESQQQEIIVPKKSVVQFYIPTTDDDDEHDDDEHEIGCALPPTLSPTKSEFAVPPTLCLEESDTYTVQTCATSNTMATNIPDVAFEGELWKETQQKQSAKRNNNTTTTATSKYDKYRALQAPRIEVEEDNVVNPDELENIQNNLAAEYERKKDRFRIKYYDN